MQRKLDIHTMDGQEDIVQNMLIIDDGKICEQEPTEEVMQKTGTEVQQQQVQV